MLVTKEEEREVRKKDFATTDVAKDGFWGFSFQSGSGDITGRKNHQHLFLHFCPNPRASTHFAK